LLTRAALLENSSLPNGYSISSNALVFAACALISFGILTSFDCRAEGATDDSALLRVTNVIQISQLSSQNPDTAYSVDLHGIILWANSAEGKFVLRDASGAEELEMDLHGRTLQPGQRIRLQGHTTITTRGAGFQLGTVGPVVDDDGVHTMTEKSGSVYLSAGRHPFSVDWFNRLEKYGLQIEYQGPALARQKIPDSVLFRAQTNADNSVDFVSGLNYACYPATEEVLPDFNQLTALKTGVVTNFDLSVIVQPENIGLEFNGYLQVPRDGLYTFYLTSDDGSRMFVGEQPPRLEVAGLIELPKPQTRIIGQVLSEGKDYERVEVEGDVTFVSERKNGWELELSSETGRLRLQVADSSGLPAAGLLNSRVRVTGITQSTYEADGERAGGVLLVSDAPAIKVLKTNDVMTNDTNALGQLPLLTTASQVHELTREQAQRGYPVKIQGIVTCVFPERQALTIQDATRGIYVVDSSESRSVSPKIGEYLQIEGKTDPSLFAPIVIANAVKDLGTGYPPQPVQPTWDRLMNGSLDAQYVELQGVVTTVETNGLTLFTGDDRLRVALRLVGTKVSDLAPYEDAVIRVRGCLLASWDYVTHLVQVGDIRLYGAEISVEQPAPADMFSLPSKTVAELLQFNPQASVFQRVKVSGVIICAQPPEYYLTDGKNGLQFILKKTIAGLEPGDSVDVVGFPALNGLSPVLREAVVRTKGKTTLPEPEILESTNLLRGTYDSSRVRIDGLLEGVEETPAGKVLQMQSGGRTFAARLNTAEDFAPGSKLELTGVYLGEGGNRALGQDITSFQLLLNSPADVKVLAQPPWWTLKRLVIITGGLVCVLAAAALWITQLHRQVEQRTTELGAQIQQRQTVEHQRAMEQERTRIAQDLHDELGSGITEISMLAARAKFATIPNEKRSQYLEHAREKAGEMVTVLDEIVWAMNPKHDSLASLVSYFSIYADRFLGLANIAWHLESGSSAANPMVGSQCRHQVFLAFKEALTNVVRHAEASEVRLSFRAEDGQLRLTVSDNGRGLSSAVQTEAMDGIANMRARIEKLGGKFEIDGGNGSGTTVQFYIPLNS
jgi:signal transduction histidine kinase